MKKRQKVRRGLLIVSFLLFPVTIYYLSPYLIIMGASEGIITGSFVVFAAMFFTALFFGRAFCGWICPAGGLQECMTLATNKKFKGGWRNYIKYAIWLPWVAIIAALLVAAGGARQVDPLYMTTYGISVAEPGAYIIYYFVIALIVGLSFVGRRAMCHTVCWMAPFMILGTKVREWLHIPGLHLTAEKDRCVACGACTKNCPMSLPVQEMAAKGSMKNTECILCGACADTCPNSVIRYGVRESK